MGATPPPPLTSMLFLATCPVGPWLSCCWPHMQGPQNEVLRRASGCGLEAGGGSLAAGLLGSRKLPCAQGEMSMGKQSLPTAPKGTLQREYRHRQSDRVLGLLMPRH